jgi:hypothetical protein
MYLSSVANIAEKPGVPSRPTDVEGLIRFIAFKMSNAEIGSKYRKSLDNGQE